MVLELENTYGSAVRPPRVSGERKPWAKDPSHPGADDGTRLDATFVNDLIGLIRGLLDAYGISASPGDDTALAQAIAAAIANHTHSVAELEDGDGFVRMTTAERAKLAALVANYKGSFASLALLAAAYPVAEAGEWAVLTLPGEPASIAVWDADAEPPAWVDIDGAPPQTASNLPFTPTGSIEATTVQEAIEELDQEKQPASANLDDWSGIEPSSKADTESVNAALAVRLQVDAPQSLTPEQRAQGRANLGLGTGPLAGYRNKLINADGWIQQRIATSVGDDTYGHDRHYALTQTGNITISTLRGIGDGIRSMMRLTQAQATAQRMGYAQIIESGEVVGLRGRKVTLGGKLRFSSAAPIRFALLEWTGTADQVTSDVVNNWASTDYTAGNFFIAGLTVAAVGSITPAANTITDWSIEAVISSSANNLIAFFWTQNAAAQNANLDMRWYLVEGEVTNEEDPFSPRFVHHELYFCHRYFERLGGDAGQEQFGAGTVRSPTTVEVLVNYSKKRASPTISFSNANTFRVVAGSDGVAVSSISAVERSLRVALISATVSGSLTVGNGCFLQRQESQVPHIYVDAEL